VFSTQSAVGGNGGSLRYHAQSYLENGERLLSVGSGTYESSGNNRWRTHLMIQVSNGTAVADGEVELANRSLKRTFEQS
jgi:hypothetical protein